MNNGTAITNKLPAVAVSKAEIRALRQLRDKAEYKITQARRWQNRAEKLRAEVTTLLSRTGISL